VVTAITVDCGAGREVLTVPDDAVVLEYVEQPAAGDSHVLVERALDAPRGLPPLGDLVRALPRGGRRRIVIAFDDPNRPAVTVRTVLPSVARRLAAAGVDDGEITLISANGMHPKFSGESLRTYLGAEVTKRFGERVLNHDCEDAEGLVDLGTTAFGDVVEVNRVAMESDLLIYVGNVAANIWGGYSGSGIVVGLGGSRAFTGHHGRGGIGHPDSCHGQPRTMLYQRRKSAIHEAIERARGCATFYVEAMTDARGVIDVFAGRAEAIRERAWAEADRRFVRRTPPADVLVVGLAPAFLYGLAANPLIALTGVAFPTRLWLGTPLLRRGGVVIGVTDSAGVVDPATHPGYEEAIETFGRTRSFEDLARAAEGVGRDPALVAHYRAGGAYHPYHPFWLFNEDEYAMTTAGRIIMAGARPGGHWDHLRCMVTPDFAAAWSEALSLMGPHPRVTVLPTYWSKPRITFDVQ
jgi:hypothetical protein